MIRVGVVGHVEWVEFIPVGHLPTPGEVVHAGESFTRAAGGGGVVSVVLAELGAEVDFYTALGEDDNGRAAAGQLADRGVHAHVEWRPEATRRALTMLEDGGERTIVTIGDRLDPHGSQPVDWDLLRDAGGVYVTAGDNEAFARALAAATVVASPRARTALHETGPRIDAIVFSARDADEREWAAAVADRARLLVATDGADGGRWWGESEGRWGPAPLPGPIRDSYGCGDSFAAGFTFGLATDRSVAEAAALGAECGARCLTRPGAP